MSALAPSTVLRRAPRLRVDIDSDNQIRVVADDKLVPCGMHGLAILDVFYQATALSAALEQLKARVAGPQEWMALTSTIEQLYRAGILRDEQETPPALAPGPYGYDAAAIHIAMLNDRVRTAAFVAAIEEVVRPGDVVVDIGTGTGVLAIAAARAGARHVYAVEASGIGAAATCMIAAAKLADRITLIPGWSTQITLPERADVLVSEIIGNEPLAEHVLEVTADARRRLLKADARLVPGKVRILGLPVTVPRTRLMESAFTAENLEAWHAWYGIDFTPFAALAPEVSCFTIKPHVARDWATLGEPLLLAEVDLRTRRELMIDHATTATASASGELDGVVTYVELELGPRSRLSTHPARADERCSWRSPVWVLANPLDLKRGDQFVARYRYRAAGARNGVTVTRT